MAEFMNWQELAAAHRKLKADHEALRDLVDKMADAIENHIHGLEAITRKTTKPLKQRVPTLLSRSSRGAERTPAPGAPAGE